MERISRERFIRLGTALGVGAAAASLVACSGGSGGGSGSGSAGSTASGGGSGSGKRIAREAAVPKGKAAQFKESGQPAVLIHLNSGKFVAYSAVCTHQGCTVAYNNGQLVCPCHGSVFDPTKGGAVVNGPAQSPLPKIPVKVKGGEIVRA